MFWYEEKDFRAWREAIMVIMSWTRSGGSLEWGEDYHNFHAWMLSIGIDETKANFILDVSKNGKMELEESAHKFISNLSD